jgi:hypothetical protein
MEETDISEEKTEEQVKMGGGASNFKPWLFKKGTSGNPKGRPPGTKSLKTWVKEYLQKLPDDEKEAFIEGMPKDIIWRMGEGQPHQTNETDVKGVLKIEFAKEFDDKGTSSPSKAE